MKKRMLVCVCAGCAQFIASAANIDWTGEGGDTLFTTPGNWGGSVPAQGDQATIKATGVTVTFPSGGYEDKSVTEVDNRASVTFDTRGTFWLKPANSTWGNPTFRIGGGSHSFNIEGVNNAKAQMLVSNAVIHAVATANEVTTTFESGYFDFYKPDGIASGNLLIIGHDQDRRHAVIFQPGTTSLWDRLHFRAKGPENVIRINGGRHEVFNEFKICNQGNPGTTGTIHIAGGELVTHYFNHLGDNTAQVGQVVIAPGGQWTSRQSIEIGAGGYGIIDITGGTLWQDCSGGNHDLRVGHGAGRTGIVNVVDGRLINTNYQVVVGYNGIGFLNQSGGRVDAFYTHVGFNSSSTGSLHISGGTWVNLGNGSVGNNGYGEMTVSGGSFSADKDVINVGKNAAAVGRLTLAGGNTSFVNLRPGQDGGDGIITVTGGTNRFETLAVGNNPSARSLVRIGGGTNDIWGGNALCVGSGGFGEVEIYGGITVARQIRIGLDASRTNAISCLTVSGGLVRVPNTGVINVGDSANNSGHIVLDGGVLETPVLRGWSSTPLSQRGAAYGSATLAANGGTVRATRDTSTDFVRCFDLAALGSLGLTIDTAGYNITTDQIFSNQLDAAGSLIKAGVGTLTLSGVSGHAVTAVAGGVLTVSGSGTPGDSVIVTNGATLSLMGDPTGITLQTLTLGDGSTSGWLELDPSDTITITEADGLRLPFARLRLSDAFDDRSHTLFTCAGTVTLAELEGLEVANPIDGKAYTFAANTVSGTTTVTLTIQDKTEIILPQHVWDGDSGGAWGTGGNWTNNAAPQAGEAAVFPDAAVSKFVTVTTDAAAGALSFESSSGGYTLTGTDTLTLDNNGTAGAINVLSGTHAVSAPLALVRTIAADVAPNAELTVSELAGSGNIAKTGDGMMRLDGANTFTGAITANGGLLDITTADAFGAASPDRANLMLASGTLRYSGSAASKTRGFTVSAPSATVAAVLDTQSDLTLDGTFWNDRGALIKRGAGMLELRPAGESKLTSGDGTVVNNAPAEANLDFTADGASPTTGFAGLTVAEGALRIVGNADTVTRLQHIVFIGTKTTQGTAQPALEIDGGTVLIGGGSKHTYVGAWATSGSSLTNPAVRVTGGATATFDTLNIGHSGGSACYPELLVDGSTIETYWANNLAGQNNGLATTVVRNGSTLVTLNNETRINNAFSILIDNSTFATRNIANANARLIFGGNARGTLTATNGGRIAFPHIIMESSHAEGVRFLFDNGIFQPTMDGTMLFRNDDKHTVAFAAGGGTFEVNDGITYTVARPLTGVGGLTKTGTGTLVLAPTLVDAGDVTNATGLIAGDYDGVTRVAAGTLAVSAGTIRPTAHVAVDAGATLDLSASTVALGKLSGTGVAANGTLAAAIIAPGGNDGDVATLTVAGLDFTGTTFQCDVVQDGNGAVIKNDILDITGPVSGAGFVDFGRSAINQLAVPVTLTVGRYNPANGTPNVSVSKARGIGHSSVIGVFSAANGEIRVTLRYTGGTILELK